MQKNWIFPLVVVLSLFTFAATAELPKVGRKAAAQYLGKDSDQIKRNVAAAASGGDQVLMLSVGTYIGSKAYQWKGSGSRDNVGRASYGLTYKIEEWGATDLNLRADFNEFKIEDERAVKLSLMPLLTFPQATSKFPIYFGIGAGVGVFFQQIPDESNLSLDYQLVTGARFFDLFENFGFFFEFGLKNHLHVLSDGQLNGTVMTAGAVFTF